jgi:protein arginine kinase activator
VGRLIPCDECRQRPAAVHVVRIVNGQKEERNLCERCALEKGELPFAWEPHPLQQLLAGMLSPQAALGAPAVEPRCPTCGMGYAEFARTSLLGCPDCYRAFGAQLKPLLRRVHGADRHRGRAPARHPGARPHEIARLRAELQDAVAREDYERAAALRDRLRAMEA